MTSSIDIFNHKSVSLMAAEIWQIEIFQGQFDLDLLSQGHPKFNQFILFMCSINLSGL